MIASPTRDDDAADPNACSFGRLWPPLLVPLDFVRDIHQSFACHVPLQIRYKKVEAMTHSALSKSANVRGDYGVRSGP